MKLGTLAALLCFCFPTFAIADDAAPLAPLSVLAVQDGAVSVRITDGSLVALVHELGRKLGFEVIAHGVKDTPVTLDFERLPQSAAIRAICQRVGYVAVPDPATGKTMRLVLTPTGRELPNRLTTRHDPLPPLDEPMDDPFASPPIDEKPPETDDDAGAGASRL